MWQLESIHIKRLQSHYDSFVQFLNGETTMVYGNNLDDTEGADSNGAGKSVVIRGITIALVDIPNRDYGKEDYVMDGCDDCEIELHLSNKTYNQTLVVYRQIFRNNKSSVIRLTENGKVNTQITSVDEGNKRILELLDITKEDLLNYYIINQNNSHSFFEAGDADKKRIISRFTNTDLLDIVLQEVKADLLICQKERSVLVEDQIKIQTKIETLRDQITYEQEERAKENIHLVESNLQAIEEAENEITNVLNKAKAEQNKIKQLTVEVKKHVVKKDAKILENQKQKAKLALPKLKEDVKETEKLIGNLNTILSEEITCPNCSHHFSLSEPEADLEDMKQTSLDCKELLKGLRLEIKSYEDKIDNLDEEIDSIQEQKRLLSKLESNIEDSNDLIKRCERKVDNLKIEVEAYRAKIKSLEDVKVNSKRIKELQDEIKNRENSLQSLRKKIEEKEVEEDNIKFWEINFSEMGLKTFLINKVLENLEGHINNTLLKFRVNLKVKINGFTVLKTGKIKETINVLISKDGGKLWKTYKRFSGGQRERVNVSGILTLHRLINESSKFGGLNFLALDEFFEGLDVKGQKAVLPILEASGITCLVISHMNNNIGAKNELQIDFEDGISTIAT